MVGLGQRPEWPDKVVCANVVLVVAGAAGALYQALALSGASTRELLPGILADYPASLSLALCLGAAGAGIVGIRYQAAVWTWLGTVAGVASFAVYGLVPVLCLLAPVYLFLGWREGEEMTHDERTVGADAWPDKAIVAALMLTMGGLGTLFHAGLAASGRSSHWWGSDALAAGIALIASAAALAGARRLRRLAGPTTGTIGGVALIAGGAFGVVGPIFGVAALILVSLAAKEDEFDDGVAGTTA